MPDITMCMSEECKLKDHCYRYTAEPSQYRQSYADFFSSSFKDKRNGIVCPHFIPSAEKTNSTNK